MGEGVEELLLPAGGIRQLAYMLFQLLRHLVEILGKLPDFVTSPDLHPTGQFARGHLPCRLGKPAQGAGNPGTHGRGCQGRRQDQSQQQVEKGVVLGLSGGKKIPGFPPGVQVDDPVLRGDRACCVQVHTIPIPQHFPAQLVL